MDPSQDLAALGALTAGPVGLTAHQRRRQKPGQSMLTGAQRPGDQVEVTPPAPAQALFQIILQPVIPQQAFKAHGILHDMRFMLIIAYFFPDVNRENQPHRAERLGITCFFRLMIPGRKAALSLGWTLKAC